MGIYRGSGGSSDLNSDITYNQVVDLVADAEQAAAAAAGSAALTAADVVAADASAVAAAASETNAATSASNAATEVTYAAEWANNPVDTLVSVAAGGDGLDDYSAMHHAIQAASSAITSDSNRAYAQEWANNVEDDPVSVAAGGDNVTTFSALHYAAKAAASYDSFDDRYLGAKASAPTLDNDGNAIIEGAMYWNSVTNKMNVYADGAWDELLGYQEEREVQTATAGQTVFSLSTISYDVGNNNLSVYVNGVKQILTNAYTETNATTVTFVSGLAAGDEVEFITNDVVTTVTVDAINVTSAVGTYVATAGDTSVNVQTICSGTYVAGVNNLQVWLNGVLQNINVDYTEAIGGASITFTSALSGGDVVTCRINTFTQGTADAANVTYTQGGTGSVPTNVAAKLQESISVRDFGAVGDGIVDDTAAVQAGIDYAMGNNKALFFPKGSYLIDSVTAIGNAGTESNVLMMLGEFSSARRHYDMPSRIIFNDNGTTTGNIGLESQYSVALKYLQFDTLAGDARGASGDFIGLKIPGSSMSIEHCIFLGCSGRAIYARDCGYASITDSIFRYNKVGFEPYLDVWAAHTTCSFTRVHGFQNGSVMKCTNVNHSTWKDCIWEYNGYGVENFGQNCEFINCYAEQNSSYGAYSASTRGAVMIGNYSNGAGDAFVATGSTGPFGFDSIGATEFNQTSGKIKELQFYNRSGVLSEKVKASHTAYSGTTVIEDSSGTVLGAVPKRNAPQEDGGQATQTHMLFFKGTTSYVNPTGYTITHSGTGIWTIDWDTASAPDKGDTRWPFIFAQGCPAVSTNTAPGQKDIICCVRARDGGTQNWEIYANLSKGIQLYIYIVDPATGIMTLSDEAAFVQINW